MTSLLAENAGAYPEEAADMLAVVMASSRLLVSHPREIL